MKKIYLGISVVVSSIILSGCMGKASIPDQPTTVAQMMEQDLSGNIVGWENYKDDADNDKVPDYKDKCPKTPLKAPVDENGCPLDLDKDGVIDLYDNCPNTVLGTKIDKNGCPLDSDGDGVKNEDDKCPNTPKNLEVDKFGCVLDTDEDAIPDYKDKCLDTPKGALIDADGCALDDDKDGIPNGIDECPMTKKGVIVGKNGCGLDSDNDSILDGLDQCPKTLKNVPVNEVGCPLDSDNDGVPDYMDKCENTPSKMGVDNYGCPFVAVFRFNFPVNSSKVDKKYFKDIEEVANVMKANPKMIIEIQGHTDNQGSYEYNQILSVKRAYSVRGILIKRFGIKGDRIKSIGYGYDKPVSSNKTAEGRKDNRRIAIVDITNRK
jgi:outer membrane protein OmpA-like peptidoglycan-associated protein